MTIKNTSGTPSHKSAPPPKRTALGRRLAAAALDVAAHVRGETLLTEYAVRVPAQVDVAALRRRLDLSQAEFARAYGLDVKALQAWEQNRRRPDRTARILLTVIDREPAAVLRALTG